MESGRIWWQLVGVAPSEKCNGPEQPLGLANRHTRPRRDPYAKLISVCFLDRFYSCGVTSRLPRRCTGANPLKADSSRRSHRKGPLATAKMGAFPWADSRFCGQRVARGALRFRHSTNAAIDLLTIETRRDGGSNLWPRPLMVQEAILEGIAGAVVVFDTTGNLVRLQPQV